MCVSQLFITVTKYQRRSTYKERRASVSEVLAHYHLDSLFLGLWETEDQGGELVVDESSSPCGQEVSKERKRRDSIPISPRKACFQ